MKEDFSCFLLLILMFSLLLCLLLSRETVKAHVFGSHIAAPTMSLAEFGDQQKAEAEEREERSRTQAADGTGAAHNARRLSIHWLCVYCFYICGLHSTTDWVPHCINLNCTNYISLITLLDTSSC